MHSIADGVRTVSGIGGVISQVAIDNLCRGFADAGHARDIAEAQSWVDHLAARAHAAEAAEARASALLAAAMRETAVLRSALRESDAECLRVSVELGRLRRAH